jgi:hypothetical protein
MPRKFYRGSRAPGTHLVGPKSRSGPYGEENNLLNPDSLTVPINRNRSKLIVDNKSGASLLGKCFIFS